MKLCRIWQLSAADPKTSLSEAALRAAGYSFAPILNAGSSGDRVTLVIAGFGGDEASELGYYGVKRASMPGPEIVEIDPATLPKPPEELFREVDGQFGDHLDFVAKVATHFIPGSTWGARWVETLMVGERLVYHYGIYAEGSLPEADPTGDRAYVVHAFVISGLDAASCVEAATYFPEADALTTCFSLLAYRPDEIRPEVPPDGFLVAKLEPKAS